jgi:hypothetical protein
MVRKAGSSGRYRKRPGARTPEPVFRERKTMSAYETADVQRTDRVAAEGRPADCDCWDATASLPCWPCYREGFDRPNPEEPVASND